MPTYYPQLDSSGTLAQYPYSSSASFDTVRDDMDMGRRYAFARIGAGLSNFPTEPLYRWPNNYSSLTQAQADTLEAFFDSMAGRFGEFTYLDPGGNLVKQSELFSHASWSGAGVGSTGITDPWGGSLACTVSGSLSTTVLPDGGAAGFVLCGSVYVKGSGSVTLSLSGAGSRVWTLPANDWTRVFISGTIATSSAVAFSIALPGAVSLFGAQCVPMPGPGEYAKSPGNYGLHSKCRFDTDELSFRHLGPDQIAVSAPIAEYF